MRNPWAMSQLSLDDQHLIWAALKVAKDLSYQPWLSLLPDELERVRRLLSESGHAEKAFERRQRFRAQVEAQLRPMAGADPCLWASFFRIQDVLMVAEDALHVLGLNPTFAANSYGGLVALLFEGPTKFAFDFSCKSGVVDVKAFKDDALVKSIDIDLNDGIEMTKQLRAFLVTALEEIALRIQHVSN